MQPASSRLARNPDLVRSTPRLPGRRTRLALLVLAATALLAGAIPAANAATGGASIGSTSGPTASSSGEDLVFSPMRIAGASWYGPGLYGNKTACGQTLRPNTLGVAHKRLPCGTTVKFVYHGRVLITQVIDRGPYIRGRAWDLTAAASEALGFESVGVGNIRYSIGREYARPQG